VQPDQLLSATILGEGPNTIVFGNGLSTTQQVWSQMLTFLPADWRVVRFDYVGTTPATSAHWDATRYQTYAGHAEDLRALLQRLDAQRLLFVGHSMSGMIGAIAETTAPGLVSELFMIGASPSYVNRDDYHGGFSADDVDGLLRSVDADLAAWMAGFGPMALGRDATPHQLAEFRDTLLALRPDIGRTLLRSIFTSDNREVVPRLTCPVSVVQCADDVAVPTVVGNWLAAHTRCALHEVLPVSGHLPHVTHPALLGPLLRAACERVAGYAPLTHHQ
jgi:sigma-B regulation protein RsbQ